MPDDGRRYELYEGELIMMPSPRPRHQVVIGNLYVLMAEHVRGHGLGQVYLSPIDVILSAPTLVVEVLSPSTGARDRGVKQALYARYGVPFYWIVDSAAGTVQALRLSGESYEAAARLDETTPAALPPLTDLRLDPTAVWR